MSLQYTPDRAPPQANDEVHDPETWFFSQLMRAS